MASGKTIATLARAVFTRISQQIDDHIDNNPHLHCPPDTDEPHSRCPLGDAFGIQYLCESDNPIRNFARSTARGKGYVDPTYTELNHPLYSQVILHGYTIGDGYHLSPIDASSPPLQARELLLDVKIESDSKNPIRLGGIRQPTTFDDLLGMAVLEDELRAYLDWAGRPSPWSGRPLKVCVKQKGSKVRPIDVVTPARLAPRSITFDEYNLYQGAGSNLHKATISICRRPQPGGQAAPWVYFLSGTPANKSMTDFDASYSIIQSDREKRKLFEDATRRLDRCWTRHSSDHDQAETQVAMVAVRDMISSWLTARSEGSPILDGNITTSRSLPKCFDLTFDTPPMYQEGYERLLHLAQEEIA
ncbi:hypothetical protein CDV31_016600 [Fusarium ambrosium]|uniref:Uncharacterized protein n=1 Tax=Fusarium ambrosium TaxID=131363 RepID=A0A428S5U6_9HYPO|nr:hypothetical protein CDV31_016600 [Fusarium ambrosium]